MASRFDAGRIRIWLKRPSPVAAYAIAVILPIFAQIARSILLPHLLVPYVPFLVIAGAVGGLGPGLLATLLCAVESLIFTSPGAPYAQGWTSFGALVLTGVITSFVFEELKSEGEQLHSANTELAAMHAESKRTEEKLGVAHRSMVTILESISDGFSVFDHDWRYTYINAAAARQLHRAPDELLGKKVWEVWPQAWDLPFGEAFRRAIAENAPTHVEAFYPDPLNAWFEVRCYPSPTGLSIFFNDVTERKRAEQELRENQERLSLVIQATDLGTVDWFPQKGTMVWSDAARAHLGLPPDAPASYETLLRAVHPEDRERLTDLIRQVLRHDRIARYETEYRTVEAGKRGPSCRRRRA
jgi:PAS domain S-box-containing protein